MIGSNDAVYLGGRKGFELVGTGSTVRAGTAVLARADSDGSTNAICTFDSDGDDFYDVVRSARPMLVLNYGHPLTHAEGAALSGRAAVWFLTPASVF